MKFSEFANRLDELTRPEKMSDVDQILSNAGYYRVGKGEFGEVFRKEGRSDVLKIFKTKDRAYKDFVLYCKSNPNRWLPVFKGNILRVNDDYNAIRMEILKPIDKDVGSDDRMKHGSMRHYLWRLKDPSLWQDDDNDEIIEFVKRNEDLKNTLEDIADIAISNGYILDLHKENIMKRGNQLVIADPLAVHVDYIPHTIF